MQSTLFAHPVPLSSSPTVTPVLRLPSLYDRGKKGLKKQNKSFQKGRKLRGEGKGSKEGQQKGQKGRGHASGWQRRSGRPSRRSRYAQRQRRVGVRGRCPVSSQCDSEVHRRGVQGTEGGSGRKHKRKVTAACNPGTGTRRRREARQERCDGERRSTPGGQPPGRVRWRRAACHHNL